MQLSPHRSSFASLSGSGTLKRPYAQQTLALDIQQPTPSQPNMSHQSSHTDSSSSHRPKKTAKVEAASSSSPLRPRDLGSRRAALSSKPLRGSPLSGKPGGSSKGSSRRGQTHLPSLPEPRHDYNYIVANYKSKPLRQDFEDNAKSPLSNYHSATYGSAVNYDSLQYRTPSGLIYR